MQNLISLMMMMAMMTWPKMCVRKSCMAILIAAKIGLIIKNNKMEAWRDAAETGIHNYCICIAANEQAF